MTWGRTSTKNVYNLYGHGHASLAKNAWSIDYDDNDDVVERKYLKY